MTDFAEAFSKQLAPKLLEQVYTTAGIIRYLLLFFMYFFYELVPGKNIKFHLRAIQNGRR